MMPLDTHPSTPRTQSPRSRTVSGPSGLLAVLALAAMILVPGALAAQQPIGGVVVDATSRRPLVGAQVVVEGTGEGTQGGLTDNRGRFLILNVPGESVTIRVVLIGYRTHTTQVAPGRTDLELALHESAISLDEIVVTGTAGQQQARAIGNSVGQLEASELIALAPPADVQRMISGQVPGVRIMTAGGEVGSGGTTRIRGASSLTLGATPLIYVDGVRVNGDDNSGFGGVGTDFSQEPSRISDFNAEEIESIEIIKGPAAATLYGTEASNGVIQIITKRGRQGAPRVNVTVKQGANWFPDVYNLFPETFYRCSGTSANAEVPAGGDPEAFGRFRCTPGEITPFNVLKYDRDVFGHEWFRAGHNQAYGADVTGGSESVTYYMSANWDKEEGGVPNNWKRRMNGRANLTYTPSDQWKIDFSLGMVRSAMESPSAQQPLSTAIIWSCPAPGCEAGSGFPNAIDGPFRGYIAYLPEAYENEIAGFQDVDRTTFSLVANNHPTGWFNHRLTLGGDFGNYRNSELYRATGNLGNFVNWGRKIVATKRSTFLSADYGANLDYELGDDFSFTTSGGVQFYQRMDEETFGQGEFFPVPALETISSGSVKRAEESFLENRTFGVFVQEQVAWKDRLYLTGAVRGDDNSAFGKNFDFVVYPKLSASYVMSDEPFLLEREWIDALKLRAAWGQAGKQPDVFDALRTYEPTVGPDGASVLTPENIGNADLKPEVGEELELGFDASFLSDRLSLEFTYYDQKTTDAIVRVPALPSLGFPGVQFRNLGEVSNKGIELGLRSTPIRSDNVGLDLGFMVSSTENEIVSLGGQPPVVQSATFGQMHLPGFPLASIFMKRVVSSDLVERNGRNVATNVMCEGGPLISYPGADGSPIQTNFSRGGGAAVPCAEAPAVLWGQPVPKWEGSVSATLTLFRNLQIYALVDWIEGLTMVNGDVAASHRFFLHTREILERDDPILMGYEALGGAGLWQTGTIDADFGKLRTVSATYTLPSSLAERFDASRISVTVSAENLWTIWVGEEETFGHENMDPERFNQLGGATPGLSAFNQEGWPQLKRFLTTFRISF